MDCKYFNYRDPENEFSYTVATHYLRGEDLMDIKLKSGLILRFPTSLAYRSVGSFGCRTNVVCDVGSNFSLYGDVHFVPGQDRKLIQKYSSYEGITPELIKEGLELLTDEQVDKLHNKLYGELAPNYYCVVLSGLVNGTKGLTTSANHGRLATAGFVEYLKKKGETIFASPILANPLHNTKTDFSIRRVWTWTPDTQDSIHIKDTEYAQYGKNMKDKFLSFEDWKNKQGVKEQDFVG